MLCALRGKPAPHREAALIDSKTTADFVNAFWDEHIVPTITEYITIPNKSPAFDADWEANGFMEQALQLALAWLEEHPVPGMEVKVGRLPGRTPMILVDVPATGGAEGTILMYGHLDKQPEMTGWREDLGPWIPKYEDGKLYGRGGADDGYALFASVCSLLALGEQGVARSRVVLMIEFSEESGSPDLPAYVDHYKDLIGTPDLVVCLDSGAGNYEQMWSTTSLRGLIGGTLDVHVLREGVHSGDASGVVPSSFRVARQLLSRLEDPETGRVLPESLWADIPEDRRRQAERSSSSLGEDVYKRFPWAGGMQPTDTTPAECVLNRTWRPALSITGIDGVPPTSSAGSVLRPHTRLKLSLRLPPTVSAGDAAGVLTELFTTDVPYDADVRADFGDAATGWNAPPLAGWLEETLDAASETFYGKPCLHMGEGGTIPFMAMLNDKFPDAQFVVTGVLGPNSNAHGPNEFLHVPYAKKLTSCICHVLAVHGAR
ncbi:MAG: M20/M25/M40 family metallo-hydrolase [Deltaproteobacteria bacterium]|nr:M20/M25/M40 family metallo-hydrolase [Deltaproteobacteria bacterium]